MLWKTFLSLLKSNALKDEMLQTSTLDYNQNVTSKSFENKEIYLLHEMMLSINI
jgi:hypothetical protein